jgi:hypothetical protein
MDAALEEHRERLFRELDEHGVVVRDEARAAIREAFERAGDAFAEEPERVDELAENTDRLVAVFTAMSELTNAGVLVRREVGAEEVVPHAYGSLSGDEVRAILVSDCLWPFCREGR